MQNQKTSSLRFEPIPTLASVQQPFCRWNSGSTRRSQKPVSARLRSSVPASNSGKAKANLTQMPTFDLAYSTNWPRRIQQNLLFLSILQKSHQKSFRHCLAFLLNASSSVRMTSLTCFFRARISGKTSPIVRRAHPQVCRKTVLLNRASDRSARPGAGCDART